jgi:hypothetical protein
MVSISKRAGEEGADERAGKAGDHQQHGVAEDVAVEHLPFGAALGARGQHVLLANSSRNEFLVSSVMVAKAPSAIDTSGSVMCQK